MIARRLLPFALALAVLAPAVAEEQPARPPPDAQREQQQHGPGVLRLLPGDAVSDHSIELASGKLAYSATAGTLPLIDQSGERQAEVCDTA